jgi:hypothetical protein
MTTSPIDDVRLKALFKEVLAEVLDQRRDWFLSVVTEALEDIALVQAIKEGEQSEDISRDEIFQILRGKA